MSLLNVIQIVCFAIQIFAVGFLWGHSAGVKRGRELATLDEANDCATKPKAPEFNSGRPADD